MAKASSRFIRYNGTDSDGNHVFFPETGVEFKLDPNDDDTTEKLNYLKNSKCLKLRAITDLQLVGAIQSPGDPQ